MGGLLLDWMDEEMCNVMILFIWHVKFVFYCRKYSRSTVLLKTH